MTNIIISFAIDFILLVALIYIDIALMVSWIIYIRLTYNSIHEEDYSWNKFSNCMDSGFRWPIRLVNYICIKLGELISIKGD